MGNNNEYQFENWLRSRPLMDCSKIGVILATDDEDVDAMYRRLEYRVRGVGGWTGPETGIKGIDMTEDYRGELRDIRLCQNNSRYPFSFGDYIVKTMIGVVDPSIHSIDLPSGMSIYSDSRGMVTSNDCCTIL